jgi:superfamily II DNA/RNA helicase
MVARVLQAEGRGATMIFTRTKRTAQKVADDLAERGFSVGAVHGDLGQIAREKALKGFRNGKVDVLVATDVAARGIDIDDVTHVINYQCPEDEKTYVHRIGRTGRAGRTGIAVTLVDWDDIPRWQLIDKALSLGIPDPVETYSSSPHLYEELSIPADAKGTVRKAKAAPEKAATDKAATDKADAPKSTDSDGNEEKAAPRRNRTRRRTRAGASTDAATSTTAGATTAPPSAPAATAAENSDEDGAAKPRRRRRRRPAASATAGAAE